MARLIEIRSAIFVILEVYIMVKNKEINKIDSSHVSAEQIINEIQSHTEIFRSLTGEAFIKAETDNSIVPLDSTEFECWLRKFCFYQLV